MSWARSRRPDRGWPGAGRTSRVLAPGRPFNPQRSGDDHEDTEHGVAPRDVDEVAAHPAVVAAGVVRVGGGRLLQLLVRGEDAEPGRTGGGARGGGQLLSGGGWGSAR